MLVGLILILVFWLALGVALASGIWRQKGWSRLLPTLLLTAWLGASLWVTAARLAPWLLYSAEEDYHLRAIIRAIGEGKSGIPLADTTNFEWSAVCRVGQYFNPSKDETALLKQALNTEFAEGLGAGEGMEIVFGTPSGKKTFNERWEVFSRDYAERYPYSPHVRLLNGKRPHVKMLIKDGDIWSKLCYEPDEILIDLGQSH